MKSRNPVTEVFTYKTKTRMHHRDVFSAITPHTSLVIVQLSQAPPIGRNFYKRRGFVLIALALIEQLAVEAEETALAVSRGITHLSAINLPDLQTKELQ